MSRRLMMLRFLACMMGLATGLCMISCTTNPYYDPNHPQAHITPTGFVNANDIALPSAEEAVGWQWRRWIEGVDTHPQKTIPQQAAELQKIHAYGANQSPQLTWVGHSTMLIQLGGLHVLTDPHFSNRASPFSLWGPKRLPKLGLTLSELPKIDYVVISHNHYDHLDQPSVEALAKQAGGSPHFLVPLGVKQWFTDLGITNVTELDWWQSVTDQRIQFVFTPARHWSNRGPFDVKKSLWGGMLMMAPERTVYYTGDTAYGTEFASNRQHFESIKGFKDVDMALIPIGCYEPRDFMKGQHVNPQEAVQIFKDIRPRQAVGVHWGTFLDLCDEKLDQAPIDLEKALQANKVVSGRFEVMAIGQTKDF